MTNPYAVPWGVAQITPSVGHVEFMGLDYKPPTHEQFITALVHAVSQRAPQTPFMEMLNRKGKR